MLAASRWDAPQCLLCNSPSKASQAPALRPDTGPSQPRPLTPPPQVRSRYRQCPPACNRSAGTRCAPWPGHPFSVRRMVELPTVGRRLRSPRPREQRPRQQAQLVCAPNTPISSGAPLNPMASRGSRSPARDPRQATRLST
ncbi:hypothetical protein NDU88_006613 [Pleurodeles waltl]|uniref:Uncharacterized protein n=1 Tax=Pleurodeles waltl TaxID=8319 RepID=A0AAV7WBA1_PLEWA|nr:hypothetical protein NDU88_006613 [Pleurodeles waltl]